MRAMSAEVEKTFRYRSRKEYERAISDMIRNGEIQGPVYDELLDEYLQFCSDEEDGQ